MQCGYEGGGDPAVLQVGWSGGESDPSRDGANEFVGARVSPGAETGADNR